MQCLNCGTQMTTNQVVTKKDNIAYEICDKCGRLWLAAGQLEKMGGQSTGSTDYCEEKTPFTRRSYRSVRAATTSVCAR